MKDDETLTNLRDAYARECSLLRRYAWFARMAQVEGYEGAAEVLRELAEAVEAHADGTLDYLKHSGDPLTGLPIGGTEENLYAALTGEQDAALRRYPKMAQTARDEGHHQAAAWFETLARGKQGHLRRLKGALEDPE